jgi:hypothetical protein
VSGHWPADPVGGGPIAAALPVTAASLLHVRTGDTLQLRDRISDRLIRFTVTGCSAAAAFRPGTWAWPPPRRRPRGSGCTRAAD